MTKKSNIVILAAAFCLLSVTIDGQTDTAFNALQEEFGDFQQDITSEFLSFLSENDSLFLKFLEQSWKEYRVYELERDEKPKPITQPILPRPSDTTSLEIKTVPIKTTANPVEDNKVLPRLNKPAELKSLAVMRSFELFGAGFSMQYNPGRIPELESVNEKSIQDFYRSFSGQTALWKSNITLLIEKKELYKFNDWGYYLVLQEASKQLYSLQHEQILFVWFALIKSGYQVKIGYADESIYLLVPSLQELYNVPYLSEQGLRYYMFGPEVDLVKEVTTYSGFYTDAARIFSFSLLHLPVIEMSELLEKAISYKGTTIQLSFQKSMLDYLGSMPQVGLEIYYLAPLAQHSLQQLDHLLAPFLGGKSERHKVDQLLNFVQTAIPYKTDKEQFGSERYMFAEECLFFPGADCEDRTVLLKQLVEHYTDLPMISLEFSNHVTLAVHFTDEEPGDYVIYEGKAYYICDPTFLNAKSGMLPADLKDEKPGILAL